MIRRTFKKSMVIALTAAMMTTSVPGIFQGTVANVFASESVRQMAASVKTKAQTEIPKADMLDIIFNGGKVEDRLNGKNELKTYGAPVIAQDEQLGKEVAVFDGQDDGFGYLLTSEDWKAMGSHYSFECMVKESNEDVQNKFGTSLLGGNSNRDGGIFYFKAGGPTFTGLKALKYTRDLTYKCEKEKWLHLVGTYDGKALKFYVNGKKQGEFAATEFTMGQVKTEEYLNIAHNIGGMNTSAACKIASARAYSKTLSLEEVKSLYQQEDKTNITVPTDASFVVAKGDTYTVPTAEVTTATGTVPEITTAVKDQNGNDVTLDENRQFTATEQGEYKIFYTANGITLEKSLRVTGEPSIAAQIELAVGDQETLQIQNLEQGAKVIYTSADSEIAAIDEKGVIQAKKAGETTVDVTVEQAGHTYMLHNRVVVTNRAEQIFTVTFKDYDGKVLDTQEVKYEEGAKAPKTPTRAGYTFTGWDKDFSKVTGDLEVTAQYKKNEYKVTFKDYDGKVLDTQTVKYEEGAKAPKTPTRAGYTFTGWDKTFSKITADMVITARYQKNPDPVKPSDPTKRPGGNPNQPQVTVRPGISVTKKQILSGKEFRLSVRNRIKGTAVNYKTSNKKIASVDRNGNVKGLQAGKAIITTTVRQGGMTYSLKTSVTVKGYVKLIKVKKAIKKGKSYKFKAKAYGIKGKMKWSLSSKKIGKISKSGTFKAKKKGKIYVIVKVGKYSAKYRVKVK